MSEEKTATRAGDRNVRFHDLAERRAIEGEMPSKARALKRYNGSPLGLNQRAESGLPWYCLPACCSVMQEERQEKIFYISDSKVPEPTHAPAVGVPMTHIGKVRLHTICAHLSVNVLPEKCVSVEFL